MAEQDYPIEQLQLNTIAANDELPGLESEATSTLSQNRLEARYLDANLLAANDENFSETSVLSAYPVDAFFQACQRHLKFGPSDAAIRDRDTELVQVDLPGRPAPSTSKSRGAAGKGPSYAL